MNISSIKPIIKKKMTMAEPKLMIQLLLEYPIWSNRWLKSALTSSLLAIYDTALYQGIIMTSGKTSKHVNGIRCLKT